MHKNSNFPLRFPDFPQETTDLVTFTEKIPNGKLHFLCSVFFYHPLLKSSNVTSFNLKAFLETKHCVKGIRIRSYSGPHFPALELRFSPYSVPMRENADQNNSEYEHFSRSEGSV